MIITCGKYKISSQIEACSGWLGCLGGRVGLVEGVGDGVEFVFVFLGWWVCCVGDTHYNLYIFRNH